MPRRVCPNLWVKQDFFEVATDKLMLLIAASGKQNAPLIARNQPKNREIEKNHKFFLEIVLTYEFFQLKLVYTVGE
jgi:hypothetical protein